MSFGRALPVVAAILLLACSGAAPSDMFEEGTEQGIVSEADSGAGAVVIPTSDAGTTPTPTPTIDSGSIDTDGGTIDSGNPGEFDAGSPGPIDSGLPVQKDAGGPPGPVPCTQEQEPNDSIASATVFTSSFCGKVAEGDVDHGSIVAPAGAKTLTYTVSATEGAAETAVFIGNARVFAEQGAKVPVVPGMTYSIRIRGELGGAGARQRPRYEVTVKFQF